MFVFNKKRWFSIDLTWNHVEKPTVSQFSHKKILINQFIELNNQCSIKRCIQKQQAHHLSSLAPDEEKEVTSYHPDGGMLRLHISAFHTQQLQLHFLLHSHAFVSTFLVLNRDALNTTIWSKRCDNLRILYRGRRSLFAATQYFRMIS